MASKNSTKKQQVQSNKAAVALGKAASININSSLSAISQTSVKIQADLSKIGEELIQKHAELQAVDETIALKKQEIENLHGVDAVLLTLDEARAQHTQAVEQLAQERQQVEQSNQQLEVQKKVERDREQEQFTYNLQQKRKADADAWTEQVRVRGVQETERQEKFEKDLATREAALKAKETEYQTALQKAATFDADVAKEVAKAESILKNVLTRDFNHKQEISDITHKTTIEKYQFDQQRMVQTANTLEQNVKDLQAQLKAAYEENAKLASKAVDGAANAKATADAISTLSSLNNGNGTRART